MLKNVLNLEGVTVLQRDQQEQISGGINYENCAYPERWFYDMSSECEAYYGN